MATEKRQCAIEKRKKATLKKATLKKATKTAEIKAKKLKEKFNDNKNEVIEKMIEFGIYEESLKNPNWFLVHGDYLFAWQDGEYSYMYTTDKGEMARLLKLSDKYCEREITEF